MLGKYLRRKVVVTLSATELPKIHEWELMVVSLVWGPTRQGIDHQKPRLTGLKSESCFLWVFHICVKVTITDALGSQAEF